MHPQPCDLYPHPLNTDEVAGTACPVQGYRFRFYRWASNLPSQDQWSWRESNPLPLACHASALPNELQPQTTSWLGNDCPVISPVALFDEDSAASPSGQAGNRTLYLFLVMEAICQ